MPNDTRKTVRRFDVLERLDGPKLLPNGWLRADAHLARTGIQEYRDGAGNVRRELRLPEDVFNADALSSFEMVPVTDDHPEDGLLTAENTSKHARGHVGENVRRDGDKVRASVLITDAELVKKVLSGKQELSCGYVCELEETAGEWQGQRFDAVQRHVRGNHVAVVAAGRAGPEVRLKLDAGDAVSIRGPRPQDASPGEPRGREETEHMVKITIDGIEVEVANDQASQLIARALKAREDARSAAEQSAAAAKSELDKATGRADALDAKVKELEKVRADAADPKRVAAAVKARVALEARAREVLDEKEGAKLDELDDQGVKRAVLAKLTPSLALDGKDAAYVDAAYEVAISTAAKDAVARVRAASTPAPGQKPAEHKDATELRADFVRETEDAWKKPNVGFSLTK